MSSSKQRTGLTRRQALWGGGLVGMSAVLASCIVEASLPPTPTPVPGKITFLHGWKGQSGYDSFLATAAQQWQTRRSDLEVTWLGLEGHTAVVEHFLETTAAETPVEVSVVAAADVQRLFEARNLRDLRFATRQPEFAEIAEGAFLRSSRQFRNAGAETFGLPVSGPASRVLAIHSGLLEEAGLNPKGNQIMSWEALDILAEQFTTRDGDNITRSGYALQAMDLAWFTAWVNTTASTLFNPEQSWANLNSDGAVAALQHLVDLHSKLKVSAPIPEAARSPGATPLVDGAAAIHDDLSWAPLRHYRDAAAAGTYWQIPYPKAPGGPGSNTSTAMDAAVVHVSIERPGHALSFLQWFCGSLELAHFKFSQVRETSPLVSFYQSQEWIKAVDAQPVLATIPEIAEIPGAYAGTPRPSPYRRHGQFNEEVLPIIDQAYRSGENVVDALEEAHAVANKILSEKR